MGTPAHILESSSVRPVLVVDDEPALLEGYIRTLANAGVKAEGASNGLCAAALLKEKQFDVIVSDISMPGMDGMQLLRTVREQDVDAAVILVTGSPALETAMKAVDYGALRYIVKPFQAQVLVDAVMRAQRLARLAQLRREAVVLLGSQQKQIDDRAALSENFDRGLAALWMAYQPIVSWSERRVYAFEALLRCGDPSFPHPGAFLDAAERLERLPDLGRAIRDRVASAVGSAPSECVFVNLHPRDLLDDHLYAKSSPLSKVASRVVLEITERAALEEILDGRERVARLRKLGFRIAIDDLGAGYAGLTSFAQLEPEIVKFDMSLVRDLHRVPHQKKLVGSMAALFKEMGSRVVAEGVETVEERNALVEIDCDLFQGYLFAKPSPAFPSPVW